MGKDQTLKPEVREQLYTAIDDDTNWLINMTENLLAATQLETDRTKLKTAPELLEDLFQSAVRQLDRRARDHHISVDLEDQTLMASMNAGMIQRVIINMMNNAIQYTPKDSHIILSGTRRKDWVEISVSVMAPGSRMRRKSTCSICFIPRSRESLTASGDWGWDCISASLSSMPTGGRSPSPITHHRGQPSGSPCPQFGQTA